MARISQQIITIKKGIALVKILLLGENGQLGSSIKKRFKMSNAVTALSRKDIDLMETDRIIKILKSHSPDIIINAAAYTNVDLAESNQESAYLINSKAINKIAEYSYRNKSLFIHYSTDYVFDGNNKNSYLETDLENPINIYGKSKLEGENVIKESECRYIIFRTSWVYSDIGNNFPKKILDLASKKDNLKIVVDQIGSPTPADLISEITEICIEKNYINSLYHLTSSGKTTRLDFAKYLINGANIRGKKLKCAIDNLEPILSKDTNSLAKRPKNSILDCTKLERKIGIKMPRWQENVDLFLNKYFGVAQ